MEEAAQGGKLGHREVDGAAAGVRELKMTVDGEPVGTG